jgi:hypothetical protein
MAQTKQPESRAITRAMDDPDQSRNPQTSLSNAQDRDTFPDRELVFPDNLETEFAGNYVRFTSKLDTFSKVTRKKNPNIKSKSTVDNVALSKPTERTGGIIKLPMPQSLLMPTGANYEDLNIGKSGVDALRASSIKDLYTSTKGIVSENIGALKETGISALLSAIATDNKASELVGLKLGKVRNPHMQTLFQSTPFRTLDFNYVMRPRDEKETRTIANIVKFFRYYMSPSLATGETGVFFKVPNQFGIEFIHNGGHNKALMRVGKCVLESFSTNYTPDSVFNAYHDGAPLSIQIDLKFKEIEVITKEKINGGY